MKEVIMSKESKDTTRMTVDLTISQNQKLEDLRKATDASTRAEVIREALKFYSFIVKRSKEGYRFFLEKNGNRETVILPED